MGRNDLIRKLSDKTGLKKSEVSNFLDALQAEVTYGLLYDGRVSIRDFVTFNVKDRNPQLGRNPYSNEVVMFPPVKVIKCKISETITDYIKNNNRKEPNIQ